MTMNDTWGYKTNDTNWKSAEQLIHYLIYIAAKGGNYLLNVGPTSEGLIPEASVERFAEMGKWLKINGEAIYGTSHKREVYHEEDVYFTTKDNCLYLIATKLEGKELFVKSVQPVENSEIQLLGSRERIIWKKNSNGEGIIITVPEKLPCDYAWVFKMKNN